MAPCGIQQLNHQEMLIKFSLDACMGQLHRDILSRDQRLGLDCTIGWDIMDQDQWENWRAKPCAEPSTDTEVVTHLMKLYLAPAEPVG